jgi:integrase
VTADPSAASLGLHVVPAAGDEIDRLYAADAWRANELGVPAARGREAVSFSGIGQSWLRQAAKRWAQQRLATGYAFNTVQAAVLAFKRFSGFLATCSPPVAHPHEIDRALLERYLAWLAPQPLADSTKGLSRVFLRAFLEENRRYRWVAAIPAEAVVYPDELSSRRRSLPRFIPEFVMGQLESEANLAELAPPYRHLLVLLVETGLRAGDACALKADPLVADSAGWSCLRFASSKMRAEHLLPLSTRAVEAVRSQHRHLTEKGPENPAWLFPSRSDPARPLPYETLRRAFISWQRRIALHDEANRPVRVSLHQLRHTLGTRLINSGVPQHVIQRLLGHASPTMTAVYAQLHDATLRAEFERYCQSRVDVEGRLLGFDPQALTADAEWVKHRLSRTADTLPNGYCGRPRHSQLLRIL